MRARANSKNKVKAKLPYASRALILTLRAPRLALRVCQRKLARVAKSAPSFKSPRRLGVYLAQVAIIMSLGVTLASFQNCSGGYSADETATPQGSTSNSSAAPAESPTQAQSGAPAIAAPTVASNPNSSAPSLTFTQSTTSSSSNSPLAPITFSTTVNGYQFCTPGAIQACGSGIQTCNAAGSAWGACSPPGTLVSQPQDDLLVYNRLNPSQSWYNYAPDVILDGGVYHMYICAGTGGIGDYVIHAQSTSPYGPFHASNNASANTYDVALQPTTNTANFDGSETCDPSVLKYNGTFYLYYGGLATQSNSTSSTKVGIATSTDGIHFTRALGGNALLGPVRNPNTVPNNYGAGQPAVIYISPYFYMSFTDTTGPGADGGGGGQFMIRAQDPLFQTGVQELTASGWTNRASASAHTSEYAYLDAFSIDMAYDPRSKIVFLSNEVDTNHSAVMFLDPNNNFKQMGSIAVLSHWQDGVGLAKNSDRTTIARSACSSFDALLYKATGTNGYVFDWNITLSEGIFDLTPLCAGNP